MQDLNRYVAIAEEFPNDAAEKVRSGGLMHDRRIARVITPGTLIDENFIDPYASNYVMAIHIPEVGATLAPAEQKLRNTVSLPSLGLGSVPLGLAWLDLSTGQFCTQVTALSALGAVLSRVAPREIVLDQDFQCQDSHDIFSVLAEDKHLITYAQPGQQLQSLSDWAPLLESEIHAQSASEFSGDEVKAGSLLLSYVRDRLQGLSMKLQPPIRYASIQVMNIDKNSMRSLEIKQTIRDGAFRGSLLHAIRRTVTKSGARLLSEWLSRTLSSNCGEAHANVSGAPSTSLDVIDFRQTLVSVFIRDETLRDGVILLLRRSHDSQRLVQKFALGRGDPDDLLDLAKTIQATEDIETLLGTAAANSINEHGCLSTVVGRISLEQPLILARRIRESVDEEGLVQQHQIEDSEAGEMIALAQDVAASEGIAEDDGTVLPKKATKKKGPSLRDYYGEDNQAWIMRPEASPGLIRLHGEVASLMQEKEDLTEDLRRRLRAASLTLKWTPGLGHICHIKGKDTQTLSDADIRTLSSRRTTRSFHHPEWTALGQRIDQARFQIRAEEQRVFHSLREEVVHNLVKLRRNAAVLDELDIATSFARLAVEQNLTRPLLNRGTAHTIVGGRHPTVEGGLTEQGRTFTSNDCFVGAPGHGRLSLITGPNMAGKSTFLRQNALITILAQLGCYVPADYAELGLVDAIFSRVGSADNLYRNQSTFMVEMLETAQILRDATPRSFVIMDEIGRGTTPEDGTAVAFASLHHLVHVNRCRTLFATHFHALADLAAAEGMCVDNGGDAGAVEMYCTDVREDQDGGFVYVHRLRKGINRQSHALKVAQLAGLPERAIQVSQRVLDGTILKRTIMRNTTLTPGTGTVRTTEAVG